MIHELPSLLVVTILLIAMLLANEAGRRFGAKRGADHKAGQKAQTNATLASILATLALLLGFTFTMSLQRYDARSEATIGEANAIGTAYLRSELLTDVVKPDAQELLVQYIRHRTSSVRIDMSHVNARKEDDQLARQLQDDLWRTAIAAAETDPNPTRSGLFISSLNEMIDSYGARQAALEKHLPAIVLYFLFTMLIIAQVVLGYASGISKSRPKVATLSFTFLIVLVVFLIFDLDRPRRGFVQVNQGSMIDLRDLVARK